MAVNANAQRSLARTAGRETTRELLQDDRAHRTPRMRDLVAFFLRVMESVERGDVRQGFFGALQLVIPERFTGARLRFVEEEAAMPAGLAVAMSALGRRRLATLEAEPRLGEALFDIGDGQGRCFAFYSFQRAVADALRDKRARLREAKRSEAEPSIRREVERLEVLQERIRVFLSKTDVSFVCYAREITAEGGVVGLGEEAERRLYIEGNALNSRATKEEVIKYESFSPVVVSLQVERTEPENLWMDADYIEVDARSVGKSSSKLFTLSALTQAYSYSMIGDGDPISNPNAEMFRNVAERADFIRAYWKSVAGVFGSLWVPLDPKQPNTPLDGDRRLEYLEERRRERHVAFQPVFLLALGRLGHALGKRAGWDPSSPLLEKVSGLQKRRFRAYKGADAEGTQLRAYDPIWTRAMMRPLLDAKTGQLEGYAFEHTAEKVRATEQVLFSFLGLDAAHDAS
jgi:hypothetical protein